MVFSLIKIVLTKLYQWLRLFFAFFMQVTANTNPNIDNTTVPKH